VTRLRTGVSESKQLKMTPLKLNQGETIWRYEILKPDSKAEVG